MTVVFGGGITSRQVSGWDESNGWFISNLVHNTVSSWLYRVRMNEKIQIEEVKGKYILGRFTWGNKLQLQVGR